MKRNKFITNVTKKVLWSIIKVNSKRNYSGISENTIDTILLNKSKTLDASILYIATHKSLWETVGIPYAIDRYTNDIPYIFAGDNLFKNKFLQILFDVTGVIKVERGNITHSKSILSNVESILSRKENLLIFPEGARSRDGLVNKFSGAAFQGALNASKKTNVYIIPVNVDYSKVLDLDDLLTSKKSYSFKLMHLKKWITGNIGKTYFSIGDPILITPDLDRKYLAELSREKCMDLVKILPINIYSEAIMRLYRREGSEFGKDSIYNDISKVIDSLQPYSIKFKEFDINTSPLDIEKMCVTQFSNKNVNELVLSEENLKKAKIYSNYIKHYTSVMY